MSFDLYPLAAILATALITFGLRLLPFLLPKKFFNTHIMKALASKLPAAIMIILVVYSVRLPLDEPIGHTVLGMKLIAVFITAASYLWKKSMSISIVAGTSTYMLLTQLS